VNISIYIYIKNIHKTKWTQTYLLVAALWIEVVVVMVVVVAAVVVVAVVVLSVVAVAAIDD